MSGALSLVVFDVDGTLVDSLATIEAAVAEAFAQTGMAPPAAGSVAAIVGLSLPVALARLAPQASPAGLAALVEAYRDVFVAARENGAAEAGMALFPGARDALDRLAVYPELLLGVATGKARRGLDHLFEAHDLRRYFVTSQTADTHPSKPHPSMLEATLSETGVEAHRAVMVGDTTFDIEMGRAAGFATIGVSWGCHPAERLSAAGADIVIDGFDQLDRVLAPFLGSGR